MRKPYNIDDSFVDNFGRIHLDDKPLPRLPPAPPLPPRPSKSADTSSKPNSGVDKPQISFPTPYYRGEPITTAPKQQISTPKSKARHSEGSLVIQSAKTPPHSPAKPNGFPTSPSEKPHSEQCHGITKQAKRCTRRVKSVNSETLPRFCHQHSKDVLAQKGYYNTRGDWLAFEDWIPRHLSSYTQIQLRVLMEKPISATDSPGYIYVYTLSGSTTVTHVEYKIGRTNNINRRLDNWTKQCNRELVLRQHFPTSVAPSSRLLTTFAVDPKIQCVYVNRLERLIHLELSEYNDIEEHICKECGCKHKEIFRLRRMQTRQGTEFEGLIRPVIEKWNAYVARYC